jgi:ATP-dependent exoDNAse (exonuclease V) alpha subunit
MAIFLLSAKIISRAKGQSVIASAAYRAGERLLDPNRLTDHDYTARNGIEHTQIMAPDYAPDWVQVLDKSKESETRQLLWQRVEEIERKKNSQLAREVLVALPHEINRQQRIDLVRDFVARNFTSRGMVADVALHVPTGNDNPKNFHAHLLLTMRDVTPNGFAPHKRRDWNDRSLTQAWREDWALTANRHLERAGRSERIDHRSNKERGIDREPQPKLGPIAHEIEKSGRASHAGNDIRQVKERNLVREIQGLATRAIEAVEERLGLAQHPLAQEAAVARLERLLDELGDKLAPGLTMGDPANRAAAGATKGLGRVADSALHVLGGVLSFFEPGAPPERRDVTEDRIAELEAIRDRLARDEQDKARSKENEAIRAREVDEDRGRQRERDRYK